MKTMRHDADFCIGSGMTYYVDNEIAPLGALMLESLKKELDKAGNKLYNDMKKACPRGKHDTHNLVDNLEIEKFERDGAYGYLVDFSNKKITDTRVLQNRKKRKAFYYVNTTTYHDIAYFLEEGTPKIKGKKFIAKCVHKLKGLDDRIVDRWEKMAQELEDANA